jgi:hypothetical protein
LVESFISTITSITTWTPPVMGSIDASVAPARICEPTSTGLVKRTLFVP